MFTLLFMRVLLTRLKFFSVNKGFQSPLLSLATYFEKFLARLLHNWNAASGKIVAEKLYGQGKP